PRVRRDVPVGGHRHARRPPGADAASAAAHARAGRGRGQLRRRRRGRGDGRRREGGGDGAGRAGRPAVGGTPGGAHRSGRARLLPGGLTAVDVVIGIDTGTTATKAIAAGIDGRLRAQTSVHYPLSVPAPGRAELDPRHLVDAAVKALTDITAACREQGDRVVAVSL